MANLLAGLQYRELKAQLPSWKNEENYTDWQDCGDLTNFPTGTQYRVKPETVYVVTDSFDKKVLTSRDKTEAMAKVSSMLAEDMFAGIRKEDKTKPSVAQYLTDNAIQFKLEGSDKWTNATYFGDSNMASRIQFRLRPDTYFELNVRQGISLSTLTFDDVDDVVKYVERQLRTSENNLTINRRFYAV